MDAHVIHLGDEVQDIPAVFALAETVPDVLADTDPELRRIAPLVDGTRTIQTVRPALELVEDAVVLQDLFHGNGRFDGFEVNELCF